MRREERVRFVLQEGEAALVVIDMMKEFLEEGAVERLARERPFN